VTIDQIMRSAPLIPVLVLDGSFDPAALAETFVDAGLPVIEVTLRTPSALDGIRAMARVPGAIVGAGTVLDAERLERAVEAGSKFIVAPGLTEPLAAAAHRAEVPFLPGATSASDIMRGLDLGLDRFKFFPAIAAGGVPSIKALAAPFPNVRFCPTGGITSENAPDFLALEAVLCVGGSWLLRPGDADLSIVAQRSRMAAALRVKSA
jgi:2-dehydro-3-deoxyphosphogluconate aldolase/(4S)-4-hydroxy-2-oxoglutarate aldolase